ncbi:hypothetical protein CBER1_09978 [Cercospora berteroae]|uniref:BTB domain-containing protein n=1 Tax=Cercospora berteroae TaxID=357750 RepID=A0A2S6CAT9_9PEZI|nr:hypothetical protein CBER1_09978 [Cercospora berteroae]
MDIDAALSMTMATLFHNDEFADLTVRAGDTDFKVHKNILCTASPWFRAACTRGFAESTTAVIDLPESSVEVKGLLLWFYGLMGWLGELFVEESFGTRIKLAILLHMVGDQYNCPALSEHMTQRLRGELRCADDLDVKEMVDVSVWAYSQTEGRVAEPIHGLLAKATAVHLHTLLSDENAWQRVVSCAPYACNIMRYIASSRGFPQLSNILEKSG